MAIIGRIAERLSNVFRGRSAHPRLSTRAALGLTTLGLGAAALAGCAKDVDGLTISNVETRTAAAQRLVRDLCGISNPNPDQISSAERFLTKGPYDGSYHVTGAVCGGVAESLSADLRVQLTNVRGELTEAQKELEKLRTAGVTVAPQVPVLPTNCPPDHLKALLSAPITVQASKDISISLTAPEGYLFVLNSAAQVLRNGETTADVWLERMALDGNGRTLTGTLRTKRTAFVTGGSTYSIDAALRAISAEDTSVYRGFIDLSVIEPPAPTGIRPPVIVEPPPPTTPGGYVPEL